MTALLASKPLPLAERINRLVAHIRDIERNAPKVRMEVPAEFRAEMENLLRKRLDLCCKEFAESVRVKQR